MMESSEQEELTVRKQGFWAGLVIGCWIVVLHSAVVILVFWVVVGEIRNSEMETKLERYINSDLRSNYESIVNDATTMESEATGINLVSKSMTAVNPTSDSDESANKTDDILRAYRLTSLIVPIVYDLRLRSWLPNTVFSIPNDLAFNTSAELSILIHCLNTQSNITLNVKSFIRINETSIMLFETDKFGLTLDNSQSITVVQSGIIMDYVSETILFLLNSSLQQQKYYMLTMKFEGSISSTSTEMGYYRSSYIDTSGTERWVGATQFEPGGARHAFPCFDEPSLKAKFNITLVHPRDTIAISNGQETYSPITGLHLDDGREICHPQTTSDKALKQKECSNHWLETSFKQSPIMSSYLVAWVVAPFENIASYSTNKEVLFRVWSRPEVLPHMKYALYAGKKVLQFFEEYFNVKFPLPKIDQVALNDLKSPAMENWGIITYREYILAYNEKLNSRAEKQMTAMTIAHEISHQWFGNLVTMKWWDDLWLNEGFATYMSFIGAYYVEEFALKKHDQFVIYLQAAMEMDQYEFTHPVSRQIESSMEAASAFDQITYLKAASILRMLNYTIGEATFRKGVNQYLNDLKYKNAEHHQLWHHISKATQSDKIQSWNSDPLDVKLMMDHWILKPGFPIITVMRDHSHSQHNEISISLSQERYHIERKVSFNDKNYRQDNYSNEWYVPIWYQTSIQQIRQTWLTPIRYGGMKIIANGSGEDWLLVNPECRGYYRVNYDYRSWQLLTAAMLSTSKIQHFDVPSRSMLLSDSLKLARIGKLNYSIPINMTNYLKYENSSVPWAIVIKELMQFWDLFVTHKDLDIYQKYLIPLLEMENNIQGNHREELTKVKISQAPKLIANPACRINVTQCLSDSDKLFALWQKSCDDGVECDITIIPVPDKISIYCEAVRNGGVNTFNYLMSQLTEQKIEYEKYFVLSGMTCATEKFMISKLLSYVTDETFENTKKAFTVLGQLAEKPGGSQRVLYFIKSNWELLEKRLSSLGPGQVELFFNSLTAQFNSEYNIKQLDELEQEHAEFFKKFHGVLQKVRSKMIEKVNWMNKYGPGFIEALRIFI